MIAFAGVQVLPVVALDAGSSRPTGTSPVPEEQRYTAPGDTRASEVGVDRWLLEEGRPWIAPVAGPRRDGFGPRLERPVAGVSAMHRGQDLGARCGEPVRSAASGVVVQAGWYGSYGNWVLIRHVEGVTTGYAHNARLTVRTGQVVRVGQVIAEAGTSGASSGCHVHLEVRDRGVAIDPNPFFARRGVALG